MFRNHQMEAGHLGINVIILQIPKTFDEKSTCSKCPKNVDFLQGPFAIIKRNYMLSLKITDFKNVMTNLIVKHEKQ